MMAIAMQRRMRDLRARAGATAGSSAPFRIRMGISTGFCTVGNFGSQDRMDYTIIGNEVNLAARLESSAEPGSILLAHETNALVQDIVLTEEQPPITVKGFLRPINTYKIVGAYDELVETGKIVMQERDGLRVPGRPVEAGQVRSDQDPGRGACAAQEADARAEFSAPRGTRRSFCAAGGATLRPPVHAASASRRSISSMTEAIGPRTQCPRVA